MAVYNPLGDIFPALANLTAESPWGNPYLGGGDFYHCCLLGVNDSLSPPSQAGGNATFRPGQTHLVGTLDEFLTNPFPCGAQYDGGPGYPEQVWVSYSWCVDRCPGWAMSWVDDFSLRLWLKPLVTFIIPAAVFSLSIPRRRMLSVPRQLFPRKLSFGIALLKLIYKVPAAVVISIFDIVYWTCAVLAFAGPMLISAIYEAVLDQRLLRYLRRRIDRNVLSVRQRAHVAAVILFGSLDVELYDETKDFVKDLPHDDITSRFPAASPGSPGSLDGPKPPPLSCRRHMSGLTITRMSRRKSVMANYTSADKRNIDAMKSKLVAALECQTSFGAAAGAAVVFYAGNFAYTLIELQGNLGQVDLAHHLAFGMLWMVIPHVAIVSCLLLGCNNPFIWELTHGKLPTRNSPPGSSNGHTQSNGMLSSQQSAQSPSQTPYATFKHWFRKSVYRPSYDSIYKTSWIWNRGQCKRSWIIRLGEDNPSMQRLLTAEVLRDGSGSLILSTTLSAVLLLFLPCFLGAMISYTTPMVGLSCRSLTVLVYACAQAGLIILWLLNWMFWPPNIKIAPKRRDAIRWCLGCIWWLLFGIFLFASFFAGVMGTIFVLMSLYSNCLCSIPAKYWGTRRTNPEALFFLSTVSTEQVANAQRFWTPASIGAAIFLIAMTYLGWWYSRLCRAHFKGCVRAIDGIDEDELFERSQAKPAF